MPANIYNKINEQQRKQQNSNANSNQPFHQQTNTTASTTNTNATQESKVYDATIVDENKTQSNNFSNNSNATNNKTPSVKTNQPLSIAVGLGIIDVFAKNLEQHHGVQDIGIWDFLKPHVNEVIKESPLAGVPDSLVNIAGKLILRNMK